MAKKYNITVFGKPGCDKCRILNQRVEALLAQGEWGDFEKTYVDIDTESGLVAFCKSECINPQRVPALTVSKRDEASGRYRLLPNPGPAVRDGDDGARLHHVLGLQTDYSEKGRGVITPRMIASVLREARQL